MTVKVTLPDGRSDSYMRLGGVYVKHKDGTLEVFRSGEKDAHSYACGAWTDVEGDPKKIKKRGFWG